ncbi:MAG TPA: hypothetical protein VGI43_07400 [Mucilaginibacter sp.]|jgi:hypothetical protein
MKRINNLLLLITAIMLFASSCGKDGAMGPQGATGATGPQGPVGPAGPAGANGQNGSVIYSGTTAPPAATGAIGDFYLNLNTGLLYGPKTAAGWGTGFSLIGPVGQAGATGAMGATGAAGNTILSGSGAPSTTLGKNGDYYLDISSYLLYGPKVTSGWGVAVSLQGPAGTANVEYSGWNSAVNIRDTVADGSNLNVADLFAPALTQTMLDGAAFQIYFTFGAGVYTLPYTSYAGGQLNTMSYWPRLGRFIITRFTADNSNNVKLSTILQYRYIIIPGGNQVGVAHHPDLKNYEAVRKYYRLPD